MQVIKSPSLAISVRCYVSSMRYFQAFPQGLPLSSASQCSKSPLTRENSIRAFEGLSLCQIHHFACKLQRLRHTSVLTKIAQHVSNTGEESPCLQCLGSKIKSRTRMNFDVRGFFMCSGDVLRYLYYQIDRLDVQGASLARSMLACVFSDRYLTL